MAFLYRVRKTLQSGNFIQILMALYRARHNVNQTQEGIDNIEKK